MKHKYVRNNLLGFVIWPADTELYHSHVAHRMRLSEPFSETLSAGFMEITGGKVRCYGRSESLSLGGLPDDAEQLGRQLGLI